MEEDALGVLSSLGDDSNGDGSLPQDNSPGIELLSPSVSGLLSDTSLAQDNSAMDELDGLSDPGFQGLVDSGLDNYSSGLGSILPSTTNPLETSLIGAGQSLLSAFVTNPQNAATAEGQAATTAGINLAESSQIFGYILIGLFIFLIFGFFEKK